MSAITNQFLQIGAFLGTWVQDIVNAPLFRLGTETITLNWIIRVLVLLAIVSLVAKASKQFLKNFLLLKLGVSEGNREVIGTLTSLSVATLGFIVVLKTMGFDLASFAVIIGGLGIGIGFGLQEITKNLVSGLTILGESKLKVGDLIEFNDNIGHIKEISIRSTVIRTLKGSDLVVPNTELTSNAIINWNYDGCNGRVEIPVGVDYASDPVIVTEVLLESAAMEASVVKDPTPKVIFHSFGDSALKFELWVWVERVDLRPYIVSRLNFIIQYNLRQRGISIPFPQQDLWLRNPETLGPNPPEVPVQPIIPVDAPPTLKSLLKQFPCFATLNDLELRGIIEMGDRHYLKSGEILVKQGDYYGYFCVVLTGEIHAIYELKTITNRLFSFAQGDFFGERPLMLELPYPTTMVAAQETTLFLISKHCFHLLLQSHPHLADEVAQELAKRQDMLQSYQQKLKEMGLLPAMELNSPVEWIKKRVHQIFGMG
ncbi:MAG: mechanosensitive ion channel domain-containing protein [Synechocystis sp.]|nr:mechanosensitive ion channel domain-containing protein [Synechocystis sp.]